MTTMPLRTLACTLTLVALAGSSFAQSPSVIFTTIPDDPTSLYPGGLTNPNGSLLRFANGGNGSIEDVQMSLSNKRILLKVGLNAVTAAGAADTLKDQALVEYDLTGATPVLKSRYLKGTVLLDGLTLTIPTDASINDSGQVAMAGAGNPGAAKIVVKFEANGTPVKIARQGEAMTAIGIPDKTYGNGFLGATMLNDGRVAFRTVNFGGVTNAQLLALGNGVVAQTPAQYDPFTSYPAVNKPTLLSPLFFVDPFPTPYCGCYRQFGGGRFMNADGTRWMAGVQIDDNAVQDATIVANGSVVLQETKLVPGTSITLAPFTPTNATNPYINAKGYWLARTRVQVDGVDDDIIFRSTSLTNNDLEVVAKAGDPITPGSTETWLKASGSTQCMRAWISNGKGDYVLGGTTSVTGGTAGTGTGANESAVIVYKKAGQPAKVVFRRGTPLPSLGASVIANLWPSESDYNQMALSDDGVLYFTTRVKGAPLADGTNFKAFVRLRIDGSDSLACNKADVTDNSGTGAPDGQLTSQDVVTFFGEFFKPCTQLGAIPCNKADITDNAGTGGPDGNLTAQDIVTFFNQFFAGCPVI